MSSSTTTVMRKDLPVILLLYAPAKVISVLVLFVLIWGFFLVHYSKSRHSQASLAASVDFLVAFISLCPLCCNKLSANDSEVVDGAGMAKTQFF